MQNEKKTNKVGRLIRKAERKLQNLGKGINIPDKDTMSRIINDAKEEEVSEMIRERQYGINNEIRFRVKQPNDAITDFERNNVVVSLSNTEESHSSEIFAPFVEKGYTVTKLAEYEPFVEYNVYLVSWN